MTSNDPSDLWSAPTVGRRNDVSINSVDPPKERKSVLHCLLVCFVDSSECVSASLSLTQSSPCQSHNYSWWSDIIHSVHCENRFTNIVLQVVRRNSHSVLITTNDGECHLTENLRNIFIRDQIRRYCILEDVLPTDVTALLISHIVFLSQIPAAIYWFHKM